MMPASSLAACGFHSKRIGNLTKGFHSELYCDTLKDKVLLAGKQCKYPWPFPKVPLQLTPSFIQSYPNICCSCAFTGCRLNNSNYLNDEAQNALAESLSNTKHFPHDASSVSEVGIANLSSPSRGEVSQWPLKRYGRFMLSDTIESPGPSSEDAASSSPTWKIHSSGLPGIID
ncbi:hypothetical protein STEG23_037987 [Scotinomys teguina]